VTGYFYSLTLPNSAGNMLQNKNPHGKSGASWLQLVSKNTASGQRNNISNRSLIYVFHMFLLLLTDSRVQWNAVFATDCFCSSVFLGKQVLLCPMITHLNAIHFFSYWLTIRYTGTRYKSGTVPTKPGHMASPSL
jgi:hypothetical protein